MAYIKGNTAMKKLTATKVSSHLKNILEGMRQAMVIAPEDDYVKPARGEFKEDINALAGDMRIVGNDLRKGLAKNVTIYSS